MIKCNSCGRSDTVLIICDSYGKPICNSCANPGLEKHEVMESALKKAKAKYLAGVKEHGGSMDRCDLSQKEWLINLQEEMIDSLFYIEKLITDLEEVK